MRCFWFLVELLLVLASGLGLLAALHAGALVVLTLTNLGDDTGLGAATLFGDLMIRLVFGWN